MPTRAMLKDRFNFKSTFIVTTGLFSFFGVVITILFLPHANVSAKLYWATIIVAISVIVTIWNAADFGDSQRRYTLPSVITVAPRRSQNGLTLVLQKSPLFSYETLVTIYLNQNSVEDLLGVGYVETIQESGLIQIHVTNFLEPKDAKPWTDVIAKNKDVLPQLRVNPKIGRKAPVSALQASGRARWLF